MRHTQKSTSYQTEYVAVFRKLEKEKLALRNTHLPAHVPAELLSSRPHEALQTSQV